MFKSVESDSESVESDFESRAPTGTHRPESALARGASSRLSSQLVTACIVAGTRRRGGDIKKKIYTSVMGKEELSGMPPWLVMACIMSFKQLLHHKFTDSLFFFAADQVAEYKDAFAVFDREGDGKDILTSK